MPEVHATIDSFRAALDRERTAGWRIGFVPTMGYLHEGHGSLLRAAAGDCDVAAASIFVNPLQFAASEDLSDYPRDLDRDLALADDCGAAHVLVPSVEEMYPTPMLTTVTVADITARYEGASRPTHFAGVATVVAKLFSIVGPCAAYFGEKDYQQLAVVRRMAADLSMPVDVVGCPIVREADGLAMSSRNVYLTEAQRSAAPILHRSLRAAAAAAAAGERSVAAVEAVVADAIAAEPEADLDYAALVDAATLEPATAVGGGQRFLVAARFGATRLLDNIAVGS
ncbi:MAG: pantoate--beta-alanine ligase [Ilumatobacteraceae bacterium]|nr:pantoate--beta-alanine ligase [Ilumatobacteraceae bacterium]